MAEIVDLTTAGPIVEKNGIRSFDTGWIQDSINKAIATVPEGKKGAIVAHATLSGTYTTSAIAKLDDHWSIAIGAYKERDKKWEGDAAVLFTW